MKYNPITLLIFTLFTNSCFAADLLECGLKTVNEVEIADKIKQSLNHDKEYQRKTIFFISTKDKRKGLVVKYSKGDAILVGDHETYVENTFLNINPGVDFTQHALFGTSVFSYDAGEIPKPYAKIKLNDDKEFTVLGTRSDSGTYYWVFINKDGKVCNNVLTTNASFMSERSSGRWSGSRYTASVDTVEIKNNFNKKRTEKKGLRLIFNGTEGGQISIQEVWVKNDVVYKSDVKKFDQFGTLINIAGLKFQLVDSGADNISLKYEFDDSFPE